MESNNESPAILLHLDPGENAQSRGDNPDVDFIPDEWSLRVALLLRR